MEDRDSIFPVLKDVEEAHANLPTLEDSLSALVGYVLRWLHAHTHVL
jgi:hypothetical protein